MSLGRLLKDADLDQFLELETQHPLSGKLNAQDEFLHSLLHKLFAGETLFAFDKDVPRPSNALKTNSDVLEGFKLSEHESKGAWFLPKEDRLEVGRINFLAYLTTHPRYAMSIASPQRVHVTLEEPAYFFGFAVLEPIADVFFVPFLLRSTLLSKKQREELGPLWQSCAETLSILGLPGEKIMTDFRTSIPWSNAGLEEVVSARDLLKQHLAMSIVDSYSLHRFRAYKTKEFLTRYYSKFKKDPPLMRQVIGKQFYSTLAAYFGSDWLTFLSYIGENPNPNEQLATALPEPKIFAPNVPNSLPLKEASPQVSSEEIDKIVASFFNLSPQNKSPLEMRFDAIKRYWKELSQIQQEQRSGMKPLWGLVKEDSEFSLSMEDYREGVSDPRIPQLRLSPDVLKSINNLWGTSVISQNPAAIVSTIDPYGLFCETLGPALKFWHGIALTCWFVTEGPSSRTSISNLEDYYREQRKFLKDLDAPVSTELFDDLKSGEHRLGPKQELFDSVDKIADITLSIGSGRSRRDGFEILQSILNRHLLDWSNTYLEQYLKRRWEEQIRGAIEQYNRLYEQKAKKPTVKQAFKFFEEVVNFWYGGNLSILYLSIGEKIETPSTKTEHTILGATLCANMTETPGGVKLV